MGVRGDSGAEVRKLSPSLFCQRKKGLAAETEAVVTERDHGGNSLRSCDDLVNPGAGSFGDPLTDSPPPYAEYVGSLFAHWTLDRFLGYSLSRKRRTNAKPVLQPA